MTTFHTKIDTDAEHYLLNKSQYSIHEIDDIFNSANFFPEPYMQISKLQATALQFFVTTAKIKSIVEVGTFVGYSAFSMAYVLPSDGTGKLLTIEINNEFYRQAEHNRHQYIINYQDKKKSHIGGIEQIKFINADAKKIFPDILKIVDNTIDLLFLDGDKENYWFYLDWAIRNLKKGAYFLIDNALFKGGVVTDADNSQTSTSKYSKSIRDMTTDLKESNCFDYFFLPVGDCMIVAQKK